MKKVKAKVFRLPNGFLVKTSKEIRIYREKDGQVTFVFSTHNKGGKVRIKDNGLVIRTNSNIILNHNAYFFNLNLENTKTIEDAGRIRFQRNSVRKYINKSVSAYYNYDGSLIQTKRN